MQVDTQKSPYAKVYQLPFNSVSWDDGFWKQRLEVCTREMAPRVMEIMEDADNFHHQHENFLIAAGLSEGKWQGVSCGDGDFYKVVEGLVYAAAVRKDPAYEKKLDELIDLLDTVQQSDGFLSTMQIVGERENNGITRHSKIDDFQGYNFGHLISAACTHKRLTGKDSFLKVAMNLADYMADFYKKKIEEKISHTELCPTNYMALAELYRLTGDEKYLEALQDAIDIRDLVANGNDVNQDREKLLEQRKIIGHGVRATYLYAGVTDLYLETGDERYLPVLNSCWDNLVNQKIYVNGGCGALYTGTSHNTVIDDSQWIEQAFGYEYQLPNITAYNETCATLGHIFWADRMFAADPHAKYMDQIERSSYNIMMAAVSLDGKKYFYENMLRRTKSLDYPSEWPLERTDEFKCFCCPTNVSRCIPELVQHAYLLSDDAVYLGAYGPSHAEIELKNGAEFTIKQETEYPWEGAVRIRFDDIKNDTPFTLKVRVPGWLENGFIQYGEKKFELTQKEADTYIDIHICHAKGAVIDINFDMQVRLTIAHPKVEEDINQACVERGPLVYCIEHPDSELATLDELLLPSDAKFKVENFTICGQEMRVLNTEGAYLVRDKYDADLLYQPLKASGIQSIPIRLIPYFAWDNRGFGEMRVWIPLLYRF